MPAVAENRQGALNFPRSQGLSFEQVMELFEDVVTEARTHDNFFYEIAAWHLSITGLRLLEDHMQLPPTVEALSSHHTFVDALLTHGRMIWERVKKEDDPQRSLGCDSSQVRANIDWLENKRAMWHQQMHPAREREILAIFGEDAESQRSA